MMEGAARFVCTCLLADPWVIPTIDTQYPLVRTTHLRVVRVNKRVDSTAIPNDFMGLCVNSRKAFPIDPEPRHSLSALLPG